jgi:hypothetical protein
VTAHPVWSAVDAEMGTLLDLIADPDAVPNLTPDQEWRTYVLALRTVAAMHDGAISANVLRPSVRGVVKPSRIGAFCRRAQLEGLIVADGWEVSDDTESGNAGRPARNYRWLGGAR